MVTTIYFELIEIKSDINDAVQLFMAVKRRKTGQFYG